MVNEITKRRLRHMIKKINYTLNTMDKTQQSLKLISNAIRVKKTVDFIEKGGALKHDS